MLFDRGSNDPATVNSGLALATYYNTNFYATIRDYCYIAKYLLRRDENKNKDCGSQLSVSSWNIDQKQVRILDGGDIEREESARSSLVKVFNQHNCTSSTA